MRNLRLRRTLRRPRTALFGALVVAATAFVAPRPISSEAAAPTGPIRGAYGRDSSADGVTVMRASGFDTVTVQPWRADLDALREAGMRGVVWLWDYDGSRCAFERDDAWVREIVGDIAGHPAIAAYQIADEPNYDRVAGCPGVGRHLRNRSELVHSLDPGVPTYVVVSSWDGREAFPYEHFTGAADVMGLAVYPCTVEQERCEMDLIDGAIREADEDGVGRYWAVVQDFGDGWYRPPTAAELGEQLDRWGRSRMEGYFVYHWNEGDIEAKPDHVAVLAAHNALVARLPD